MDGHEHNVSGNYAPDWNHAVRDFTDTGAIFSLGP
jgi:hypothetical protein